MTRFIYIGGYSLKDLMLLADNLITKTQVFKSISVQIRVFLVFLKYYLHEIT